MNKIGKLTELLYNSIPELEETFRVKFFMEELIMELARGYDLDLEKAADEDWNLDKFVEYFSNRVFIKNKPPVIGVVKFDKRIIPYGTDQCIGEELVKHKGEIWVIHKNDSDPFPSNPHAHNYSAGLKLHLGNGRLFLGKEYVNKLRKKDFLALRSKIKFIDLPELEI